ncbi:MAG: RDD family protein [Actinobacteria bacterium]|nr:RDD family protein [Actinomycetota bacterium]
MGSSASATCRPTSGAERLSPGCGTRRILRRPVHGGHRHDRTTGPVRQATSGAPQPGYGIPQPGYGAPPQPGYGAPPSGYGAPGRPPLAEWGTRVAAYLIDGAVLFGLMIVLVIVVAAVTYVSEVLAALLGLFGYLGVFGFILWQLVVQGRTGQTIGKKQMKIKLLREQDGQVVGAGLSIGRYFVHIVDPIPLPGLPVAAVGRQEADLRRQDPADGRRQGPGLSGLPDRRTLGSGGDQQMAKS